MTSIIKIFCFILFGLFLQENLLGQSFPKFAALIGGKESGLIRRGEFLAQQGLGGMRFIAGNHWEHIPIDSFTIIVLRDTVTILNKKNAGQMFSNSLKSELKVLMVKDKIIIYDIYGRDYGNKTVFIRPLEFIIE